MATIVLGAIGGAIGGSFGGTILGLSGAVIGRAVGAALGRAIDQRLLGTGTEVVETGRIDRLRLTGASEGTPLPRIWGRVRVGGQVIWATRFVEDRRTRRIGGRSKGQPNTRVREYSYSVSLAIALCEGQINGIGRIWADGAEIGRSQLNLRVYRGTDDQLPDPKIEAVEGQGNVPGFRGVAYVVIEDLDLGPFGNRVPQFSFEVLRSAEGAEVPDLMTGVRAVALVPGTGEFALSTRKIPARASVAPETIPQLPDPLMPAFTAALGDGRPPNVNTVDGRTDLEVALDNLTTELPNCRSALLVVSWFGNDLRCGKCAVRPQVENRTNAPGQSWSVSGLDRSDAVELARIDGRPVYGGTPSDASVVEAIRALHEANQEVVFYPFLLMTQLEGNGLPNPWTGLAEQPALPWRGRITASIAPGVASSPDRTAAIDAEVQAFFGKVARTDFAISGGKVVYSGSNEWSYRRFILHYAWLARLAGGVEAFCVGSELRSLTQLRGANDSFPAVLQLRRLAADVRAILGPNVKISYAADWSEYFGYQSPEGNRYFHLDPFWADENVDFIGIDNYIPLSDWRDGDSHLDAPWQSIYRLDYLKSNISGGEGYDWFYASQSDRENQLRTPITDLAHNEPWVWRFKDFRGWWENQHHDRVDGVRLRVPTAWVPRSKPFWFTELGCPAVDRGTNEPNVFYDPKSSESRFPRFSRGWRDDAMLVQYHRAMIDYWQDPENNPVSPVYGGQMVDASRAHVWAWDTRPFPAFPALLDVWSDGQNWLRGHWISGRTALQPLPNVVREICRKSGIADVDVSQLEGCLRGFTAPSSEAPRATLQTLMLAYGFEAIERNGQLVFQSRRGKPAAVLDVAQMVERDGGPLEITRASEAEVTGRIRLVHLQAEGDFDVRVAEAALPEDDGLAAAVSEVPLAMTLGEAQAIAERWLAESQVARDTARFSLAPSSEIRAGDTFELATPAGASLWRVDRMDRLGALDVEAVRVEPGIYDQVEPIGEGPFQRSIEVPTPLLPIFLDLPLMRGSEVAHAPHLAVTARNWSGPAAVFDGLPGEPLSFNRLIEGRAAIGFTETPLPRSAPGIWDRGTPLRVRMLGASLQSASETAVLSGANLMAVGDGSSANWELIQFSRAELVGPDTYDLSLRLRGQFGTDAIAPPVWPARSIVVFLDDAVEQIDFLLGLRGQERRYRIGPANLGFDDPNYTERLEIFQAIGLRPYAPAHLRAALAPDGTLAVSWVRRTRIDGDSWAGLDVPLGEAEEAYLVTVSGSGSALRTAETRAPAWRYSPDERLADGASGELRIAVAQLSQSFGPGPATEVTFNV